MGAFPLLRAVRYNSGMEKELITEEIRKTLRETLKGLESEVAIEVFAGKGVNEHYSNAAHELVEALAEISPKIQASYFEIGGEQAKKRDVKRSPVVLLAPDAYSIRLTGAPLGEEGRSFLMSLLMLSAKSVILSPQSVQRIAGLKEKRFVEVFVSPTCPYCPQQVLYAVSAAIVRPDLVAVDVIEIFENQDIAATRGVRSVPQTFVNGILVAQGAEPEEYFVESLLTLREPEAVIPGESEGEQAIDLLIVGAGPAGLTAAIYAGRSGLSATVIERRTIGGQIMITPVVENYPGFARIAGRSLVELMVQQALQYTKIRTSEDVVTVTRQGERYVVQTSRMLYRAKGIIIASGADSRHLGVPGEEEFVGKGVSYCAECDGYFYKDGKQVVVVGGGNTAVTEALYLHGLGAKVTLVHRRAGLRAEQRLQESLLKTDVAILWNTEVLEILGERSVTGVRVRSTQTDEISSLSADGVFLAIGYVPNNEMAHLLKLPMSESGYIVADARQRTALPLVYAAGDVTGGVKQIVVAVGQGSVAAIAAFEDIASPYWIEKSV
ncbi:MAG: putative pyridine nucleotide-disulfide oxidoreductase family protein [Nitrospirae bacterium]|nr:MAG: putative pyridine nucleotide-disulfide oxidoreductase family protein [Nitrospirota bacterium]